MPIYVYLFAAVAIASVPLFVWAMRGVQLDTPDPPPQGGADQPRPSRSRRFRTCARSCSRNATSDRIVQPTMDWLSKTARRLTPGEHALRARAARDSSPAPTRPGRSSGSSR